MAERQAFTGFMPETADFLWGLTFHNERPWFEAHREEYTKYLLEPFRALAMETDEQMRLRFPKAEFETHISRIYRDARRLFGRGPYKDHLWFSMKTWSGKQRWPEFWFELGAAQFRYGMGFFGSPRQMEVYRKNIEANPARWERMARKLNRQSEFALVEDRYKRPKGDVGELLNPWYNLRWVGFLHVEDFGEPLYDPVLPKRIAEGFAFLMPYCELLMEVVPPEEETE